AKGCDGAMPLSPSTELLCNVAGCGTTKQMGFDIKYCCCSGDHCNENLPPSLPW
ncbi:hypothetical protein AB6A40_011772, partial [Gnathostoma spinigerum]